MAILSTKTELMHNAFDGLSSKDDKTVLSSLTRIEEEGDHRAIGPLLQALVTTKEGLVQQRIIAILYQVKVTGATTELLTALREPGLASIRRTILSTFWNAGLDVREHLAQFIDIALEGDAEECFECLTVIENQEIWPEMAVRAALERVELGATQEAGRYKAAMLRDLAGVLRSRMGADEG